MRPTVCWLVMILAFGSGCSGDTEPSPVPSASQESTESSNDTSGQANASTIVYQVQFGDSWASIAESVYGDPTQFQRVIEAAEGRPLEPGSIIELPAP